MAYLWKPDRQKRGKISEEAPQRHLNNYAIKCQHRAPAFMPLDKGEDRASYDRHMKALQQKCKNIHPDKQVR